MILGFDEDVAMRKSLGMLLDDNPPLQLFELADFLAGV